MAYTQAQLDELTRAIAQGARVVKYEDKEITYRNLEEMRSLRREMTRELGIDNSDGRIFHNVETRRGLE